MGNAPPTQRIGDGRLPPAGQAFDFRKISVTHQPLPQPAQSVS
jgi:hypothetical protein